VVGSLAESHGLAVHPPPDTLAEFVTELAALLATSTVTVTDGYDEPAPSASERVHVNVPRVHDQPLPEIAVAVNPLGSESVAVTVPLVEPGPAFETATEYVSPWSPWVKLPMCDLAIVRSAS
jgi:hypothetical protein